MEQVQKQYEVTFILSPQLDEAGLESAKKEVEQIIAKFNGKIDFKQSEKKDLAYPINKQGQGMFVVSELSIDPDKVNNLSKELKLNKTVLRHLINSLHIAKPGKVKEKPKFKPEKIKPQHYFIRSICHFDCICNLEIWILCCQRQYGEHFYVNQTTPGNG